VSTTRPIQRLPLPLRKVARRGIGRLLRATWRLGSDLASIAPDSKAGSRFGAFGHGSIIAFPQGPIHGERYIRIGANTLIAPHAALTVGIVVDQIMVTDPVIRIGDGCVIGRGTSVVGHLDIDIGDHVYTGMNVYITDQNHTYLDIDRPIGVQDPKDEPVKIGSGTWIGTGAVILPGSIIGRNVVVAANAVVRGEVPDHCVVAGVPARVVRRHDPVAGWQRVTRDRQTP
jgi:acetyltransferase-like isoleucine patch superfamily enzyme